MKNYLYSVPIIVVTIVLFTLDKSLLSNIYITSYISLSLMFILTLTNNIYVKTYWPEYLVLGVLIDSFYRNEIGISSIMFICILFINNLLRIRFKANKAILIIIGLIQSVITVLIVSNFQVSDILTFIFGICITFVISNYKILKF